MAVLIDPPAWPAHGRLWSHLVSDRSLAELHAFASAAGVPERGFEGDHYDVPAERYEELVAAGAQPVSTRELLVRLRNSGLRRPKRRGERVLASVQEGSFRLDAVRSALDPPRSATAITLLVGWSGGYLLEADQRVPRLTGGAPDVRAASAYLRQLLPQAPATWVRIGYVRSVAAGSFAGEETRPPDHYESVVSGRLSEAPRPTLHAVTDLPAGLRWGTADDVIRNAPPGTEPLLRIALAQDAS